jgi:hypothetical protein
MKISFAASFSVIQLELKLTPGIPYFEERRVVALAWAVRNMESDVLR